MKKFFYLLIGIATIFSYSCRSAKKIQKVISNSKKDTSHSVLITDSLRQDSLRFINSVFNKIEKNKIDFQTFSAKLKVNYEESSGKDNEFTAFLRIKKDSAIWVRVEASALLGIEALRMLITPDSVKVYNKLNKEIIFRSVSYLQEMAQIPLDFYTLQDLLVGNPIYLDSNILFYRKDANALSILSLGNLFKNYLTLNNPDYTLRHSKLDNMDMMRVISCDITYGDYIGNFSTYRKISIAEKWKLDIEFVFKQFNFNEPLSFPFTIPKNYKMK
ncbi:MAG TPA: DUF4292 domain-containing protein [Puia sp.]|nr:DUF4292 domain-containing protein [Puia sp.]